MSMDTELIAIASDAMRKLNIALVPNHGRWHFAEAHNTDANPKVADPIVRAGDIYRFGSWSSPLEALEEYGRMRRTINQSTR